MILKIKNIFFNFILVTLCLSWFIPASEGSKDDFENFLEEVDVSVLQLVVGETKMIPSNIPTRVMINNPNIADVVDVSDSSISIAAKAPGKTKLTFSDAHGEQSLEIRVIPEDTDEIKRRVDKIIEALNLPDAYTQALPEEGKVALLGKVNKAQEEGRITAALGELKSKVVDLTLDRELETVIEIDVQVLEIDKGSTKSLGFTWPTGVTFNEIGSPGIASSGPTSVSTVGSLVSTATTVTNAGSPWGTIFRVVNLSRQAFQLSIDALLEEGKARILSRPRLACQSGKEAELFVGGEKPVFSTNIASFSGASGTTVDYKEYGIKLNVKPTIVETDRIKLVLNMEVSETGDAETIGTASTGAVTAKAYPLTKRTASTELFINDGQTLAIGGLTKQKNEESSQKVPFLGEIPIIGAAFRKKASKTGDGAGAKGNTELFITLTPTIISGKEPVIGLKQNASVDNDTDSNALISKIAQPTSESTRNDMLNMMEYSNLVQKRIIEKIIYPYPAREAGFHGTVKLGLHISYIGDLLDVVIKQSSGYKILDENALKSAKGLGVYPPFPVSVEAKDIWIDVPVVYKIDK